MSSEAVAVPVGLVAVPLAGVALAVAAVVVPGTLAARKIKAMLDESIERARCEIEAKRVRQDEWIVAVDRQRVQMASELERAREVQKLLGALAQIQLSGLAAAVTQQSSWKRGNPGQNPALRSSKRGPSVTQQTSHLRWMGRLVASRRTRALPPILIA